MNLNQSFNSEKVRNFCNVYICTPPPPPLVMSRTNFTSSLKKHFLTDIVSQDSVRHVITAHQINDHNVLLLRKGTGLVKHRVQLPQLDTTQDLPLKIHIKSLTATMYPNPSQTQTPIATRTLTVRRQDNERNARHTLCIK